MYSSLRDTEASANRSEDVEEHSAGKMCLKGCLLLYILACLLCAQHESNGTICYIPPLNSESPVLSLQILVGLIFLSNFGLPYVGIVCTGLY